MNELLKSIDFKRPKITQEIVRSSDYASTKNCQELYERILGHEKSDKAIVQ